MTDIGESIVPPAKEPEETKGRKEKIQIRASLFFDGTLNNRTNVSQREDGTEIYRKQRGQGSYENDRSNVAKMEPHVVDAKGYDHTLKTYVEGPGTVDKEGDKLRGYAFGTGAAGVKAKVEKGIVDIVSLINERVGPEKSDTIVTKLTLDVFGFSRGAAAARCCIHELLLGASPVKSRLQALGLEVQKVEVCFAGLFDTVSSHGLSFSNDTRTLNLDAVRNAQRVIQLAAAEEYRKNFSLTQIQSAGGKGRQIFLPGAHSDIGGGYRDGDAETQVLAMSVNDTRGLEQDRARFITAGWYQEREIEIEETSADPEGLTTRAELKVARSGISNEYARIPLHVMARFARENGISLKGKLEKDHSIPPELDGAHQRLEAYIARSGNSRAEDWHGNDAWHCQLRNKYLHFSARLNFGQEPRWNGDKRQRKFLDG